MEIKKTKKQATSGSLKVDPKVMVLVTKHCKKNGVRVSFFGTEALKEKLEKEKTK